MNNLDLWKQYFIDHAINADHIEFYLKYIGQLNKNNLPVIFEYEHLSILLGIETNSLLSMIHHPEKFYRSFDIPKKKGGKRVITAPYPSLLYCQKWIYTKILLQDKPHFCAHGFVKKKSIFSNAKYHLNNKALLKMDLKNFFPSIPINWVMQYFIKRGYSNDISFYLASLCCYDNCLSQGSATSPYLSNLLLKSLDNRLYKFSQTYELKYTRYADDLTFSGNYIPHKLIESITDIIHNFGLEVNISKTRLQISSGQKIVTGLSVSNNHLTIPRKMKREIKKDLFFIRKYGFLSHISKLKINNPMYIEHMIGKLNFWLQAEPHNKFVLDNLDWIKQHRQWLRE